MTESTPLAATAATLRERAAPPRRRVPVRPEQPAGPDARRGRHRHRADRLSPGERRQLHGRRLCARHRSRARRHRAERPGRDAAGAGTRGMPVGVGAHRRAGAGRRPRRARPQRVPGTRPARAVQGRREMDPPRDEREPHRGLRRHGLRRGSQRTPRTGGAAGVDGTAGRARRAARRRAAPGLAGPLAARSRAARQRCDRSRGADAGRGARAHRLRRRRRDRLGRAGRAARAAGSRAPAGRDEHDGQGRCRRDASAVDRRHRLLHGHARHGQVRQAAGRPTPTSCCWWATAPTRTAPTRGRCCRAARPSSTSTSTRSRSAATTSRCGSRATPSSRCTR